MTTTKLQKYRRQTSRFESPVCVHNSLRL